VFDCECPLQAPEAILRGGPRHSREGGSPDGSWATGGSGHRLQVDDVIFEEFQGHGGNSESISTGRISDKRVFPGSQHHRSGNAQRKELITDQG